MKEALIIHPYLSVYAGGEVVALHTINALLNLDYHVSIVADRVDPEEAEKFYPEIGHVLRKVRHLKIDLSKEKHSLPPGVRMLYMAKKEMAMQSLLEDVNVNIVFSTQSSIFPTKHSRLIHYCYDGSDLFQFSPYTLKREWVPDLEKAELSFPGYVQARFVIRTVLRKAFLFKHPDPEM